jgi:hypothetical protein
MERNIQTTYFYRDEVVKVNRSASANSAVVRCVDHLQMNHYGASTAEVFDALSGQLHAVFRYSTTGEIRIIFKRDVEGRTEL